MFSSKFLKEITLLVIEDSFEDREIMCMLLRKMFKKVYEASDGEEGLELYRQNKDIDLIISDMNMPIMNGLELLKEIRKTDNIIPFIFITARVEVEYILDAINNNVNFYIVKPIDTKVLLEKIIIICEKKYFETRLHKKQAELAKYVEAVDNVALIFKMKSDGTITYMNKSMLEVAKYNESDIGTLNFDDIIHQSIPKMYLEKNWEDLKSGKVWSGDTKYCDKNNEIFYLNSTIFRIENEHDEDEFISIAFLTTKENIEKRDFHKKVIHNIQEYNKKVISYQHKLDELEKENSDFSMQLSTFNAKLEEEKKRTKERERQLEHYETQMQKVMEKNDALLQKKKEEIQGYLNALEANNKKIDKLHSEKNELEYKIMLFTKEVEKLTNMLVLKDSKIRDLNDVIEFNEKINNNRKKS